MFTIDGGDLASIGKLARQDIDEDLLTDCTLQAQCLGASAEPLARLGQFGGRVVVVLAVVRACAAGGTDWREIDHLPALAARTGPCRYSAGTSQSRTP